jgi:hypothetical protein
LDEFSTPDYSKASEKWVKTNSSEKFFTENKTKQNKKTLEINQTGSPFLQNS